MYNHDILNVQHLLMRSQHKIINMHLLSSPCFCLSASNNLRTTRQIFHEV